MNRSCVIFGFLLLCGLGQAGEVPKTLHLTWEGDPCTTMTAQWLRGPGLGDRPEKGKGEQVRWKELEGGSWEVIAASSTDFPDPEKMGMARWHLVCARWKNLKPGTEYLFQIGDSPVQKFQTVPTHLDKPVVFVEGGDVDVLESSANMMKLGAQQDPIFMSVGGDLAYADGHDVVREIKFWEQWSQVARASDGRVIPFVAGIGNHEVTGGYVQDGATLSRCGKGLLFSTLCSGGCIGKRSLWLWISGIICPFC